MRTVAIIQARMGSTRLPGKVLRKIGSQTMLARVIRRTQRATLLDEVLVATTTSPTDQAVVDECIEAGVSTFRGDEMDVLDRYYRCAMVWKADHVVRITSDCPLIDPGIIDQVVGSYLASRPDYASNSLERTFPRGLDTEVMSMATLARAWKEAKEAFQRAHVTPYIYQNPGLFRLLPITYKADYSYLRWTVDTTEDLELVRAIYERLGGDGVFSWQEALKVVLKEPSLIKANRHIHQKDLLEG